VAPASAAASAELLRLGSRGHEQTDVDRPGSSRQKNAMKPTLTKTMDIPVSSSSRDAWLSGVVEPTWRPVLYFFSPVFASSD
jgi:hypothetical protein